MEHYLVTIYQVLMCKSFQVLQCRNNLCYKQSEKVKLFEFQFQLQLENFAFDEGTMNGI